MQVIAPTDLSWVTVLGRPVNAGEVVDVDEEVVEALLEQGWKQAKKSATNKHAPTEAPNEEPRA